MLSLSHKLLGGSWIAPNVSLPDYLLSLLLFIIISIAIIAIINNDDNNKSYGGREQGAVNTNLMQPNRPLAAV